MKISIEEKEKFMKMLYNNSSNEMKKVLKHQLSIQGKILDEVSNIMMVYLIENDVINMSIRDQNREIKKLGKLIDKYIKSDANLQMEVISSILKNSVNDTFKFYSYNVGKKDVLNIVNKEYKGKTFSKRILKNSNDINRYIKKQMEDFVKGKISVNKIKKNIEDIFNVSQFNSKRIVDTELSRCTNNAFDKFCMEVGVKKVRYNAALDKRTCSDCKEYDGKIFDFKNKIELPQHPLCRCYYDIVE